MMNKVFEKIGKIGNVLTYAGMAMWAVKWTGKAIIDITKKGD